MPILDFHVPEATTHIIDPVAKQTIESILYILRIRKIFEDNLYIDLGYTKPSRTDDMNKRINLKTNRCDVTVQPIYNPAQLKWDSVSFHNSQAYGVSRENRYFAVPVFEDRVADIQLIEHQVPCGLNMEFSLSFKEKEQAYTTMAAITSQHHGMGVFNDHDVKFNYPIDMSLAVALLMIYKLKDEGTYPSFTNYITSNMIRHLQFEVRNTDMAKPSSEQLRELVIQRQQLSCKGLLEFNQERPEVEFVENKPDRFVVNFTYDMQFTRPETLRLYYPTVVNNRLVPEELVPDNPRTWIDELEGNFATRALHYLFHQTKVKGYPVIRTPIYEDFNPPTLKGAINFRPFFIGAVTLDGPATYINLSDLGDLQINPVILDIIRLHGDDIFKYSGIFNITVFVNGVPLSSEGLSFENDNIILRETDRTKRYHLVIYEATNITYIDQKWVRVMMDYRWFFPITIMRHTDHLVKQKFLSITPDHDLLRRIDRWMYIGKLDAYIDVMIRKGHATPYIYQFTMTPTQFGDYITNTPSKKDPRFTLYDVLIEIGLESGDIIERKIPNKYLRTRNGFPILPNKSGFWGFNAPLRIIHGIIQADQQPYGACSPDTLRRPRHIGSKPFREGGPFLTPILDSMEDVSVPSLTEFEGIRRADAQHIQDLMLTIETYFYQNPGASFFTK